MQRLRFLIWKEFLELRKDPKLFGVVVIAPILQLTMLGYAATTDVRDVPVVVADGDRSPASRELIARFEGSRNFTVINVVSVVNEVEPYLERGRAWLALSIPTGSLRRYACPDRGHDSLSSPALMACNPLGRPPGHQTRCDKVRAEGVRGAVSFRNRGEGGAARSARACHIS